jgi:hypothetical protein
MSDRLYREFIQRQRSCVTGRGDWVEHIGEYRCEACHVRRAVDAGMRYKPDFSCVPLRHMEHDIQTRLGELDCLREFLPASEVAEMFDGISHDEAVLKAKAWFDAKVVFYFERWLETLKQTTTTWEQLQGTEA